MEFEIRQVWADNLDYEMGLIEQYLPTFPIVSFDTEFPGTVINLNISKTSYPNLSSSQTYALMRSNVRCLHLIQLGLSLSDAAGAAVPLVWEFNFSDFDLHSSNQNPQSIALLKRQGLNFTKNRELGIRSSDFGRRILRSGLFCKNDSVTWVTFHGAYDFGFLVEILTQADLPSELGEFLGLVRWLFGRRVFDLKRVVRECEGLYGGLETVAAAVEVGRVAGRRHQAGSDSLLTLQTFLKVKERMFSWSVERVCRLEELKGVIHGLEMGEVEKRPYWLEPMVLPMFPISLMF